VHDSIRTTIFVQVQGQAQGLGGRQGKLPPNLPLKAELPPPLKLNELIIQPFLPLHYIHRWWNPKSVLPWGQKCLFVVQGLSWLNLCVMKLKVFCYQCKYCAEITGKIFWDQQIHILNLDTAHSIIQQYNNQLNTQSLHRHYIVTT
jgi:hypothetical protein